jgi:regulatory protein
MERIRRIRFDIARDVLSRRPDLLEEGAPATFGDLRQLVCTSQYLFVKPAAVELLARRDHSKAELLRKLQKRGFSRSVAEDAVDELQEAGWQDDRRAAESWVRSMMRGSGRSRAYLLAGLAERGHTRDVAAGAVQAYEEEHPGCFGRALQTQMDKIVRSIGSEKQLTERQRKTVISRLMRRGFSTTEIQQHFH